MVATESLPFTLEPKPSTCWSSLETASVQEEFLPRIITDEEIGHYQREWEIVSEAFREAGDLLEAIADLYDTEMSDAMREQINDGIQLAMQSLVNLEYKGYVRLIDRIFPEGKAFLNLPEDCSIKVPSLSRWERQKNMRGSQLATEVYAKRSSEAKDRVLEGLNSMVINIDNVSLIRCDLVDDTYDNLEKEYERLQAIIRDGECYVKVEGVCGDNKTSVCRLDERFCHDVLSLRNEARKLLDRSDDQRVKTAVDMMMQANKDSVTQEIHRQISEHFKSILDSSLSLFIEELNAYQPTVQVNADKVGLPTNSRKRHIKTRQPNLESDTQSVEVVRTSAKTGDEYLVDKRCFPWLDKDEFITTALHVENSVRGGVVVLDMRTEATKAIEWKMGGYETSRKRETILKIFSDKLAMLARGFAGAASESDMSMASLSGQDRNIYKRRIWYWKGGESNSRRVYISHARVCDIQDEQLKDDLIAQKVDKVIFFLGACDKQHQIEMLKQFTGKNRTELSNAGAGPT